MLDAKTLAMRHYLSIRESSQDRCNHRKGGGLDSAMRGEGTDKNHSVIKHRLPSGGLMVTCTRCAKEWHPINFPERKPASLNWEAAISLETDNCTSEGVTFATTEVATQRQIENWCIQLVRATNESIQYAGRVSKLETEVTKLRPPKQFFARLKFAFRILLSN
jgi:hypothetical protein